MVEGEHRARQPRAQGLGVLAREPFQCRLCVTVECEAMHALVRQAGDLALRKVRREHTEGTARRRHGLGKRGARLVLLDHAGLHRTREHAIAGPSCVLGIAIGPPHGRALRECDQQRSLTGREPPRLLAEVGERGGTHALDVAAEGRQQQIEIEDLVLCQLQLELARAHHLLELASERARMLAAKQTRRLHGERG